MSSSYRAVRRELDRGTSPDVLCATCPWDRLCVSPPSMTEQQVKDQIQQARTIDQQENPTGSGPPVAMIVMALTLTGRDTDGALCPVFALKLSGPDGRAVSDGIRGVMRGGQ